MFGRIGAGELIIILIIVLVIFGPSKLPQIGKSMGEAIKEFRKGTQSVEKEIKDLTDGDGLGLPICSLIASKMNGTLSIDPEYKKGNRFILVLQV